MFCRPFFATITGEVAASSASASHAVQSLPALHETHVRGAQDQVAALKSELGLLWNQQLLEQYLHSVSCRTFCRILRLASRAVGAANG